MMKTRSDKYAHDFVGLEIAVSLRAFTAPRHSNYQECAAWLVLADRMRLQKAGRQACDSDHGPAQKLTASQLTSSQVMQVLPLARLFMCWPLRK